MDILGAKSDVQYVIENSIVYSIYRELNSSWWSEIFRKIECDSSEKIQQAKTKEFIRESMCRLFPSDLQHWALKIIWGVYRTWGVPLTAWIELFPTARYVHCVRDPRETIMSIMDYLGNYSNAHNQTAAEHQFLRGHLDMVELKSLGVPYQIIKLEEIRDTPKVAYEKLCKFCGLSAESPSFQVLQKKSAARTNKSASPVLHKQEIRWKDLSKETVELSAKLGYLPDCDPETLNPLLGEPIQDIQTLQGRIATLATENTELKKLIFSLSKPSP